MPYSELEIGLHRQESGTGYLAELRFSDPASEVDVPPERGAAVLDDEELRTLHFDPEAYGRTLADGLLDAENVRGLYTRARTATEARGDALRVRLFVGPSARELHALRWELLVDPETGSPLATSERTLFSRFMVSHDWRPVRLRPKAALRALVAVASPSDVEKYKLAPADVEGEIRRARESLAGVDVDVAGQGEPLTLELLLEKMRRGVDVLYLVCHGRLSRKQGPVLLLQEEDGTAARVAGEALARGVAELREPPRLAFLASCQSARQEETTTDDGHAAAEAALAPRLAESGIPAVVAMQGNVSMKTVDLAMPVFFRELLQDGQIDRAMAVARAAIRDRGDAWMPALFLRLRRGMIWYVPGFQGDEFAKWQAVTTNVRRGQCTPVLGPELAEHVFGTPRETAHHLSEEHGFPLAVYDRSDLAKVAQYLSVDQSRDFARDRVLRQLRHQLRDRFPASAELGRLAFPKQLDAVVERQDDKDPYRILAELPAAVYVNACQDPLLVKSLKAAGREPQPLLCDWRPTATNHPRPPACDGEPSVEAPAVHHVFGVLGKADSLVLTEDDFFDYMIATAQYQLIPDAVSAALTRGSLLFLGFRLDEWTFRVLFRLIMAVEGRGRLHQFAHVGVQVEPEDSVLADAEAARRHLEQYFSASSGMPSISVYWGTVRDFLGELQERLAAAAEDTELPADEMEDEDDWLG